MDFWRNIISKVVYGGGIFFDLTKWLILLLILFSVINTFFYAVFVVDGLSMEPNLHDKEFILWDKNYFNDHNPVRGDIVVINYPGDPEHKKYVKRIVGLPGEKVDIYNGGVYINNKLLYENYLPVGVTSYPNVSLTVGSSQYFVMGDNRPNSNDSRYFGPVDRRFVLGRAIAVIFPRFRLAKDI